MSDIPKPEKLQVGFSFDQQGTHTFALTWEIDSSRKTIRYYAEFSVDKKNWFRVPNEHCRFAAPPQRRLDIPFSEFCLWMKQQSDTKGNKLDIRNHRKIYWHMIAEFHDNAGRTFGEATSATAVYEMPPMLDIP